MVKANKKDKQLEKDIDDEINSCEQMRQESIKSHDKLLISLSSGALTLSLAIYNKLYMGIHPYFLVCSWCLYFTSLLSTLFSFFSAQKLFDSQILCLNAIRNNEPFSNLKFRIFHSITVWLNRISLGTFLIASILFLIFTSSNLLNRNTDMTDNPTIAQDGLISNSSMRNDILKEGLLPNTHSAKIIDTYVKQDIRTQKPVHIIENGLTPSSISTTIIMGRPKPQPSTPSQQPKEQSK